MNVLANGDYMDFFSFVKGFFIPLTFEFRFPQRPPADAHSFFLPPGSDLLVCGSFFPARGATFYHNHSIVQGLKP
ncbi:MAG: hypothetical protein ACOY0R_15480 [Chloroflexota bacterium]